MLTNEENAIKLGYEQENMTPEEIAYDRGLDVAAVKAKLMQTSVKYRRDMNLEPTEQTKLKYTDDEREAAKKVILEVMQCAERDGEIDWRTRLTAALHVRDDGEGRLDKMPNLGNQNNIFLINDAIRAARLGAARITRAITDINEPKAIEA